jgi:hypothetical protein
VAAALLIASWVELSDSVISAAWDFDEIPAELDRDDSSDDDEFELALDSNSDSPDENASDCGSEDDLETNKHGRLNSFRPPALIDRFRFINVRSLTPLRKTGDLSPLDGSSPICTASAAETERTLEKGAIRVSAADALDM